MVRGDHLNWKKNLVAKGQCDIKSYIFVVDSLMYTITRPNIARVDIV